ncbi:MAG: preprotein translocase subunit SecY [Planctomycetota bacterium]|nr:preprotein translocase subunit SecY [Planctomycetota bacterium]
MIGSLNALFRVPDIRKRLFITFGFLLLYRVGWNIPIPGIDLHALGKAGEAGESGGQFGAIFSILSGGQLFSPALFSLGIMPYISSSIIFSLLTKVMPSLEKIAKEGASGQRKINQWTRLATVPLAMFQAILLTVNVYQRESAIVSGETLLEPGFLPALWSILTLTCGAIFLMWIGEQITEYGVGNGISLLIMAGIVARLPQAVGYLIQSEEGAFLPFMLLVLFVVVVVVVVYISKGTRKIPVQYAKLTRGRKVYGGQRHFLPIKVNQAGVMPVIFASALLSFPSLLGNAIGSEWLTNALGFNSFFYTFFSVLLIYFFSYFWTSLMFNPVEMSKNMKESGSFVPGIRPGKRTAEFLEKVMTRVTLAGATFLAVIAVIPQWLATVLSANTPPEIAYFLGGTSILIVVSVALDVVDKLNSALMMRSYEGFLRGGRGRGGRGRD